VSLRFLLWGSAVRGISSRLSYASAGVALVVGLTALGVSGHGLPALGLQLRSGQAWLANEANHSISFIDGYSGEVVSQVAVNDVTSRVVNTAQGAVVVNTSGHLVSVSNDDFSVTSSVELLSGRPVTAAAGQSTMYAVNLAAGEIQQVDPSEPQLPPVGLPVYIGSKIVSPVVAPDGSLYVGIPKTGSVGRVLDGSLNIIRGVAAPGSTLDVVLAGSQPVVADLTSGVLTPLGATAVAGLGRHLPAGALPVRQLTGSDSVTGLVGVVSPGAVTGFNVLTGAGLTTSLPPGSNPASAVMQGRNVVLISSSSPDVLSVNTADHAIRTYTMPGAQPPTQLTVQDGLVFVNAPDGPDALVINGAGQSRQVTKYTSPPPPPQQKPVQLPQTTLTKTPSSHPGSSKKKSGQGTTKTSGGGTIGSPKPPGAPVSPVAVAGNAAATVSWGAAADNGSQITQYELSWSGGSTGSEALSGGKLSATVTGLTNGSAYTFTVRAQNAVGTGPAVTTTPVTPSSTVPAQPAGVTATAANDDGSVSLTWTEPGNGDQVQSYTVTNVNTGTTTTGITGTSVTIPGVVTTASAFTSPPTTYTFTVAAVDSGGRESPVSGASNAVAPFLAPGTPAVDTNAIEYSTNGTSAALSVSCDAACQMGSTAASYTVTVTGGTAQVAPVTQTAAAGGAATTVTVTGLAPNTSYTAQVTATDAGGDSTAAADALAVPLATVGPPAITGATLSQPAAGTSPEIDVAVTVNPGGESSSCTYSISVSGGGSATDISCATTSPVAIAVPTYSTSYTATVTASNDAGAATAFNSASGTSSLKALVANASIAFGSCPGGKYCGSDSHLQPSPGFNSTTNDPIVDGGSTVDASCQTTGTPTVAGTVSGYTSPSDVWLKVSTSVGDGYMSNYYFADPSTVTADLPAC
jgi:hypothetical protein